MLIARAPVRISFAGGGTDLAAYYSVYGGLVVSATINKYFYVVANPVSGRDIQITSSDYRTFYRHRGARHPLWEGDLSLPRAILEEFSFTKGLSLFLASEIPPGTGLGSSSAVAVTLVKALSTLRDVHLSKQEIAEMACRIEIERLGMPIGKQDQYASSYGGLNTFIFNRDGMVQREALPLEPETMRSLEKRILLFFTGSSRDSATILHAQKRASEAGDRQVLARLHGIKALAAEVRDALRAGRLDRFGDLLDQGWQEKRHIVGGISNPAIDRWYQLALANGARGGKITGAGGGGFLMVYCHPQHQQSVIGVLEDQGLKCMDFQFDFCGSRVLVNASRAVPFASDKPGTEFSHDVLQRAHDSMNAGYSHLSRV